MASLIDQHQISAQDCDDRIQLFFNGGMPPLYAVPGPELQKAITGISADWEVRLTADPDNHTDNKDIQFAVVPHGDTPPATFSVAYSVALFLELFKQYTPISEVGFSKAVSPTGNDIVFKVNKNGSTVYCGDLTHLFP